jgi:hypothetical protein
VRGREEQTSKVEVELAWSKFPNARAAPLLPGRCRLSLSALAHLARGCFFVSLSTPARAAVEGARPGVLPVPGPTAQTPYHREQ